MKIIGCDLHARQQTISMLDTESGKVIAKTLLDFSRSPFSRRVFDGAVAAEIRWARFPN